MDKLEFYYVPWLLRREYSLTEEDLLNLNDPFISYYCTSDKSIAKEFYALYAKSNFQPTSMGYMEPFMIVNVQYKNGKILRIAIDKSISLFQLENRIYVLNPDIKGWINKQVPSATLPKGIRKNDCASKL
ncbi:MAG: hypothetical protein IPN33_10435 [Saprospiraceae bacterium]|nr:hypothetical protein [Saprospiraceae bacterium]